MGIQWVSENESYLISSNRDGPLGLTLANVVFLSVKPDQNLPDSPIHTDTHLHAHTARDTRQDFRPGSVTRLLTL